MIGFLPDERRVALIVEIVGTDTRDASTLYTLLNAAVTVPLLLMLWLEGAGFRRIGRGVERGFAPGSANEFNSRGRTSSVPAPAPVKDFV